jgi:hypothetical protein
MEKCLLCPANHACGNHLGNDVKLHTYKDISTWTTFNGMKCCPTTEEQLIQARKCTNCKKFLTCQLCCVSIPHGCKLFDSNE